MHSGRARQIEVGRRTWFWSDWSFSRKLFLLLMVPLIVQFALFVALCVALTLAQSMSTRLFQEQQLIAAMDQVLLDRGTNFSGEFQRATVGKPVSPAQQRETLDRISTDVDKVRQNPTADADILGLMDSIEASYRTGDEERLMLKGVPFPEKIKRFYSHTEELQAFHDRILRKVERNQNDFSIEQEKIRSFAMALIVGVCLDLLAACGSLILFNRSLNQSLRALTENSEKVSAEQELPHKLVGSDELCTIDDALHQSQIALREAKTQRQAFNSMIANDVQAPLRSIGALIQKLSLELNKESSSLVGEISRLEKNVQVVHKHVENLLLVEDYGDGKIELNLARVNLRLALEDACLSCSEVASQKNIRITLEAQECFVMADSMRLEQVVQNFLANAIKFSPAGSEVQVQLAVASEVVSVRVKDYGVGIKESDQTKLFSRFYQTRAGQSEKGFGLGLSICKELIELHGGEIGVISRPGAGATFWFSLPVGDLSQS